MNWRSPKKRAKRTFLASDPALLCCLEMRITCRYGDCGKESGV